MQTPRPPARVCSCMFSRSIASPFQEHIKPRCCRALASYISLHVLHCKLPSSPYFVRLVRNQASVLSKSLDTCSTCFSTSWAVKPTSGALYQASGKGLNHVSPRTEARRKVCLNETKQFANIANDVKFYQSSQRSHHHLNTRKCQPNTKKQLQRRGTIHASPYLGRSIFCWGTDAREIHTSHSAVNPPQCSG